MEVIELDKQQPLKEQNLSLLLGNFDGVHLGHQELIFEAKKEGQGKIAVLLFSESPAKFIDNGKDHRELTPLDKKISIFQSQGVDIAYILKADKSLFALSPEEFIEKILKPINPSLIVVGEDYRFGYMAQGNHEILKKHFKTHVVSLLTKDGRKVGTQEIVSFLKKGEIEKVTEFLGRPYEIKGKVIKGNGLGHTIDFPTANLSFSQDYILPKNGVYFGLAFLRGLPYKAMINIGTNPTVGRLVNERVEVHLLNASGNFYGQTLYVSFLTFRREEEKFESLKKLQEQLQKDKKALEDYSANM